MKAEDPFVQAELLNLIHAIATLVKCIAFYIVICAMKLLVVHVLKVDLGPAAEAFVKELRNHAKPPTFHAQRGTWPNEDAEQEKREA